MSNGVGQTGERVIVQGSGMHVLRRGTDGPRLVFLSGHGTACPTLDFKPLWSRLIDRFRVIVVERPGYGWSDPVRRPRDVDVMMAETRQVLSTLGEQGPYVLVAHSMAGLEALRWAQTHPGEIRAVIGLDPCIPENVRKPGLATGGFLRVMHLVFRIGLTRLMSVEDTKRMFPLLAGDVLTAGEKKQYMDAVHRSSFSGPMIQEVGWLQRNARKVASAPVPTRTPVCLFVTRGPGKECPDWQENLSIYVRQFQRGKCVHLDCGHYVHYERAEQIADAMAAFLEQWMEDE